MITYDQVRRMATEVVAIRGEDFVYSPMGVGMCFYAPNASASVKSKRDSGCLIGEILSRLGVDVTKWRDSVGDELRYDSIEVEEEALDWMQAAQERQDQGYAWGEVLKYADKLTGMDDA